MITKKRLAKRSIVGTRVAAPGHDGRFYPGIIESTETGMDRKMVYLIRFKDGKCKAMTEGDIIGPGFHSISSFVLKHGQKVFITYQGREISGVVVRHQPHIDEVLVRTDASSLGKGSLTEEALEIRKRVDEVRVLESRKSNRLLDQDKDFARLADVGTKAGSPAAGSLPAAAIASAVVSQGRKRSVSNCIDVPHTYAKASRRSRKRHTSAPGLGDEACARSAGDISSDSSTDDDEEVEVMDEKMAAMVLTALSCSPVSPKFSSVHNNVDGNGLSCSWASGSSSYWSGKSEELVGIGEESPPAARQDFKSCSSQKTKGTCAGAEVLNSPPDEGIELEESVPDRTKRRRRETVFQCTWPGCQTVCDTCPKIEKHVRQVHLGPKPNQDDDVSDDHEEEFYYTEIEIQSNNAITSKETTSSRLSPLCGAVADFKADEHTTKKTHSTQEGKSKQTEGWPLRPETAASSVVGKDDHNLQGNSSLSYLLAKSGREAKVIHATPSIDHNYTAKDNFFAMLNQAKRESVTTTSPFVYEAQIPSANPSFNSFHMRQPRFTVSTSPELQNFLSLPESVRNTISLSTENRPTLTGNISLPKPIQPNLLDTSCGAIVSPSGILSGSLPGSHFQVYNQTSPKMIFSSSLGTSSAPKASSGIKKVRGEMKKCRKVYGMENRDMWCTQCRWKKACTRFID